MKYFPLQSFQSRRDEYSTEDKVSVLFERTHKLEKIHAELSKVLLYPAKKKEKWLRENSAFIELLLLECKQQSTMVLNEYLLSTHGQKQVSQYMVALQLILGTLEKMIHPARSTFTT